MENLRSSRSIVIAEGVVFKADPSQRAPKKLDVLPTDPDTRDAELNSRLVDGVIDLFQSHALEVKMNSHDKEVIQRSLEEGNLCFFFYNNRVVLNII